MSLDQRLGIGDKVLLGKHVFGAAEIKAFAAKFDPQPFHLDEAAAEKSVFGRLCASGWHTISTWMKYNVPSLQAAVERSAEHGAPIEFGPAAGLRGLKWLKPVYVGDEISYYRTAVEHRPLSTRPGWRMVTTRNEAFNQAGDKVMEFEAYVLTRVA